ncbi:MAG: hypothetical protein G3M70_06790 [Candidatus Nitronauta litoralis]|uniref:Thioredoxin domain-containing protein n=1 Tax=Candidatus Nitronauta litoralis TaxID=2705533 RepID=A0A7T0G094_9BACT|nr:MAG: hypothetical protein G3M70_06790 [Candidatus Nitronauta litoralis]
MRIFPILERENKIKLSIGVMFFVLSQMLLTVSAAEEFKPPQWSRITPQGQEMVQLYYFWSKTCPHCKKAKPFVSKMAQSYDWLEVQSYEISENREHAEFFSGLMDAMNKNQRGVPAFVFCSQVEFGYVDEPTTGAHLRDQLLECRDLLWNYGKKPLPGNGEQDDLKIFVPLFGELDANQFSLPVFTIIIAGLDAFNPCAFFVLLLLLSLMVKAKDRKRMLLIGGVFVFFSGFVYFLFMAAWLNMFLFLGEIRIITMIVALLAIAVSLINIKDYFFFKKGISLTIPDDAKPGLYARIRNLINEPSLPTVIFGTSVLALVANSYELLCTAGFPMIFTRILTLNSQSSLGYYAYLVLYNIIYVIPLSLIVLIFSKSLGKRKLSEKEGRRLKLVSGLMMLGLGLLLVVAPELLSNPLIAIALIISAITISFAIIYFDNRKETT